MKLRNTKTPQGTETLHTIKYAIFNTIEKYEDPAGDGNRPYLLTGLSSSIIEKYEDPAGDGNRKYFSTNSAVFPIEKYEDPAGDGNPVPSRCS